MAVSCQECGAQLRLGIDSCPLCGTELKVKPREKAEPQVPDEYHDNVRQLRAIARALEEGLAEDRIRLRRIEGEAASGWILLDYGDVVVHIFDSDVRSFYALEERWAEAPTLLTIL